MESLDLSHNPISIAGATDLAKCLHNVQSLNIDTCEFDDVRFEKVASYLRTTNHSVIIFINAKYKKSKTNVGLSLKHIYSTDKTSRRLHKHQQPCSRSVVQLLAKHQQHGLRQMRNLGCRVHEIHQGNTSIATTGNFLLDSQGLQGFSGDSQSFLIEK